MSDIERTPGQLQTDSPEHCGGWWILCDSTGNEVGSGDGGYSESDAKHMAACWNACEGLTDEQIAAGVVSALGGLVPVPFRVGNEYLTQGGQWVRFVSVHREGTSYETMADQEGIHRYTHPSRGSDMGRVTGTDHGYGDPRNTPPLLMSSSCVTQQVQEAESHDHDCAYKRGGVICRECDLETIRKHELSNTANS